MSVAARVAGWQRRARNTPGPMGAPQAGTGESPNGLLTVELYLGGWIDITALGLVRYANGVTITGGQPDETTSANPGTCSMTLDNRDGRFSLRNPLGPYYGVIRRNTPIRVSVQSGNNRSYRFAGEVAAWPQDWDPTGTDIWADIVAGGILRRLQQGQKQLRSPPAAYWAHQTSDFTAPAVAYWPMEDGSGATRLASGIGGAPMNVVGAPDLASYTGITSSDPLPVLNGATLTGAVPSYAPLNEDPAGTLNTMSSVAFFLSVPAAGDVSADLLWVFSNFGLTHVWSLYYTSGSGGGLGVRARDSSGSTLFDLGVMPGQTINGKNLFITLAFWQNFGLGQGNASLSVLDLATLASSNMTQGSASVSTGPISSVAVNPARTLMTTTVGHLAVVPGFLSDTSSAYAGYTTESAGSRVLRLLTYTGINNSVVGTTAIGTAPVFMGPQHSAKLLDLIQECIDADQGVFYELRDQVGLGYRTHNTLANQTPAVVLSYPGANLTLVPSPTEDDTFTRNDWTVSRLNGSSQQVQQPDGPLSVLDPPAGVGDYDNAITLNLLDDSTLPYQAAWRVHLGTVDEARYTQIAVQLNHPSILNSPTLRQQILAVGMGDRIQITGPFPTPGLGTIDQLVLGVSERIDQFTHQIVWNCRPASPWTVGILEDQVLGRADTDGSALVGDVTAAAVTMQVATTDPTTPLWTVDPAQFPFDVMVSGERITVGAISGSTSPQTFSSLTRAVNGISKPQTGGTDVRLADPCIVSL